MNHIKHIVFFFVFVAGAMVNVTCMQTATQKFDFYEKKAVDRGDDYAKLEKQLGKIIKSFGKIYDLSLTGKYMKSEYIPVLKKCISGIISLAKKENKIDRDQFVIYFIDVFGSFLAQASIYERKDIEAVLLQAGKDALDAGLLKDNEYLAYLVSSDGSCLFSSSAFDRAAEWDDLTLVETALGVAGRCLSDDALKEFMVKRLISLFILSVKYKREKIQETLGEFIRQNANLLIDFDMAKHIKEYFAIGFDESIILKEWAQYYGVSTR